MPRRLTKKVRGGYTYGKNKIAKSKSAKNTKSIKSTTRKTLYSSKK